MSEGDKLCDHNTLTFLSETWSIKCYKCDKAWNITEIKSALALFDAEPRLQDVSTDIKDTKEAVERLEKLIRRYVV